MMSDSPDRSIDGKPQWAARGLSTLGVAVLVWVVLVFVAGRSMLWERDESRYATAALEMRHSGQVLYPTFNHELRAYQPVFVYWLMAGGLAGLGERELAVRLASTMAMAGVCLLVGLLARELGGCGTAAAAVVGTSPLLIVSGTAATTDATLLFFVLLAQWVFVKAWVGGPRWWHVWVMGIALGCAQLTKGPVGLVVPLLSMGCALILGRGRSEARGFGRRLVVASGVGIAMFLAWGLVANAATGGDYYRIAIVERLPARLFTAMENHGGQGLLPYLLHLPYYVVVLAVGFLPWTGFLVLAAWVLRDQAGAEEVPWVRSAAGRRALLVAMSVPTLVLKTLMVTKLPHYALPVLPWLAVLVGLIFAAVRGSEVHKAAAVRMWVVFRWLAVPSILLGLACILAPWLWQPLRPLAWGAGVLGLWILGLLPVLGYFYARGQLTRALHVQFVGMLGMLLVAGVWILPTLDWMLKPAQMVAREVRALAPEGASFAAYQWTEPGMHFYLGGPRVEYLEDQEALDAWVAQPGPKALVMRSTEAVVGEDFREVARHRALDHVKGRVVELVGWVRED